MVVVYVSHGYFLLLLYLNRLMIIYFTKVTSQSLTSTWKGVATDRLCSLAYAVEFILLSLWTRQ